MKKLVVVESPSKVKTLGKYLGDDFEIVASNGHIVDLPKSEIGVDVESNFKPKYLVSKRSILQKLKKAFEGKTSLILAVDPDREGEAIGWHVARKLGVLTPAGSVKKGFELCRIVFTEITKTAVLQAIKKPRDLDMNLFDAQQARRILDRLVGYKLSPLLWKKIRYGLSAGRVQSVALRLVVEKEEERSKFKSEEFWKIYSYLSDSKIAKKPEYSIDLAEEKTKALVDEDENLICFELKKVKNKKPNITSQAIAQKILESLKGKKWQICEIESRGSKRHAQPPLKTSTLQQTASHRFGFSSKKTMMIAQKLYEKGHITYMRTDSTLLSVDAISSAREYIKKHYGEKYLPSSANVYKTKAKVAQEAHEAIRPTNISLGVDGLDLIEEEKKLYMHIWQRTIASQMSDAHLNDQILKIEIDEMLFEASARQIIFDGYLKVYRDKVKETFFPKLQEKQELFADKVIGKQGFTKPPARYNEASLIKVLEEYGIGRPSTYVAIISTIQARKYVVKEGKFFVPTDIGIIVTKLLRDHFPNVVDYDFTAEIENQLDEVANGKVNWVKLLKKFYTPFEKDLLAKEKNIQREDYTVLEKASADIVCPECSSAMNVKIGKYGRFYSCTKWPECKGMLDIDGKTNEDIQNEAKSKEFLQIYKAAPKTEDERDYLLKRSGYGRFWAHPDYPKVKDAISLELTNEIFSKIYGEVPDAKDGKKMVLKKGRFGEYWAHPDYPKVKEVLKIDTKEILKRKEDLGVVL
jgi:DNA topoisomerase I